MAVRLSELEAKKLDAFMATYDLPENEVSLLGRSGLLRLAGMSYIEDRLRKHGITIKMDPTPKIQRPKGRPRKVIPE